MRDPAGFTLIELMVVVAIIGILAAISGSSYLSFIERARMVQAVVQIDAIAKEVHAYDEGVGIPPPNLATVDMDEYTDPWDRGYRYVPLIDFNGPKNIFMARKDEFLVPINSRFDLYSRGEDGATLPALHLAPSLDDIVRANDGAFLGLASRY